MPGISGMRGDTPVARTTWSNPVRDEVAGRDRGVQSAFDPEGLRERTRKYRSVSSNSSLPGMRLAMLNWPPIWSAASNRVTW